ncbi:uncharacterized protein LOC119375933 [Rhipicephalus sanguineus]|uniref:uncharacterized protein LOC119375933 n=1 Tax=Rhipicephalus sanguineus TaxID=34632 RepID=UPI001894A256|nr:uncharacterized protein LOC119375933 [Rhipicephalus sanguineus]
MDWGLLLSRLTAVEGQGQCLYAAVHNIQTGACIAYEPPEIYPGVSESEVRELASSHRDPLRMYSGGVSICRLRFAFLKMEGKNVILLRRPDAKCAVGFANTGTRPECTDVSHGKGRGTDSKESVRVHI